MEWYLIYLLLGTVVGFFAGLMGIGGGLIMVPALTFIFSAQDFPPERVLHLALGTTLASIIFTSVASLYTHHFHGAVIWPIVKEMTPGIVLGTLIGATLANTLTTQVLSIIVISFTICAATQQLLKINAVSDWLKTPLNRNIGTHVISEITRAQNNQLPDKKKLFAAGSIIGFVSSLVAIGGGLLTIPFLSLYNVKLNRAIGTAAAIGLPIALVGAIGYIANGMTQINDLPDYSLGYVYLPALGWVALAGILTAQIGARITHIAEIDTLRKILVLLLLLLVIKMLFIVFG